MKCWRWLAGLALAAFAPLAAAQAAGGAAQAPQAEASAPYQDKLIDGGKLPLDDGGDGGSAAYNAQGWPRFFKLETQLGSSRIGGETTTVRGASLQAQIDTPQYGALSADINYRSAPTTGVYTLRQLGMPFDGGWRANNVLGLFNPLGPALMRTQPRFILPTTLINGAGTEWVNDGRGLALSASVGQPGAFDGAQLPRFRSLNGTLTQFGAQAGAGPWSVALAGAAAHQVDAGFDLAPLGDRNSLSLALRHASGNSALQLNALSSSRSGGGTQRGFWADASTRSGPNTHALGAFQFDPNLYWGATPITSDLAGFYYRYNFRNQQWSVDGGLEALHSPSGLQGDGGFANGSARYQYSRDWSWGGGGAVRQFGQTAWSAFAFAEHNRAFGNSRAQLDYAKEGPTASSAQITYDQSWPVSAGRRLSTTLGLDRQTTDAQRTDSLTLAVLGGADLRSNLSFDAGLRSRSTIAGLAARSLTANAGLNWRINTHWSLLATYYENRGEAQLFPVLDPLTVPTTISLPGERSFFLVLRYEDRAGLPSVPLGGKLGDASGRVSGTIYLDANENGQRDASELPAANVTVVLDSRFAARTDNQGHFEFPLVAAGKHSLAVVPDNLPLPWTVSDDAGRQIEVKARSTTRIDIGATRLK